MKIRPDAMVAIMIARGTFRLGSLASSESVETASNPRKDRHSTAAPAAMTPNPPADPSPVSGAIRSTLPLPEIFTSASTTNVMMKMVCTAMMTMLARATETMPMMLRTVTIAIPTRTNTQAGTAGNAASR